MPDIFDTLAAPTTPAAQPAPRDIFDDLVDAQTAQAAAPTVTLKPKTYKTKTVNGNTFIVPDEDFTQPLKPEIPLINVPKPAPSAEQRTVTAAAPEKLNAVLQTPVWDYLPEQMKSALSPSEFALEVAKKNPSDKFMGIVAGMEAGLGKTAQAFTSPVALALLPSAGISPTAQKAMGIIFGSQMVAENPDIGKQIGEEMGKNPEDRDTAKIAALLTQGFANSSLAGLMFTHAASELLPKGSEKNAINIGETAGGNGNRRTPPGQVIQPQQGTPQNVPQPAPRVRVEGEAPPAPQRAPSPQPATPGENAGEVTFTPLTGEEAPDEIINRVSAMGGDEFAQLGQGGFNRINLPLGEKLRGNADGIASLEDALKKANDELAKAKSELGDNPTEQQIQNYVNLSAKPQFFNEALTIAKTEKPSAPPSEPPPVEASKPPLLPPEPQPAAPSAPVASVDTTTEQTHESGAKFTNRITKSGRVVKNWTQTARGKRTGDIYNEGDAANVVSINGQDKITQPPEYQVTTYGEILDGSKNQVELDKRDMTPDEIAAKQDKLRRENEMRKEMGLKEIPIPEPKQSPQPVVEAPKRETKNVPVGNETPPAQSSTDSLYEKEHADLIDAQRRMNQAQEDGDSAAARTAKQERDDILQRLDTFDSLFKRDPNAIDSKNPTVTALRRNPNLKLSDAITEGQRLAQQKKGDDAYDSALDSGASKKEAKAAAQKASTPTVRETAEGQSSSIPAKETGTPSMMPNGWPDVKNGDTVYVDGKPVVVKGTSNRGKVFAENPKTGMHDVDITGKYTKQPTPPAPAEKPALAQPPSPSVVKPEGKAQFIEGKKRDAIQLDLQNPFPSNHPKYALVPSYEIKRVGANYALTRQHIEPSDKPDGWPKTISKVIGNFKSPKDAKSAALADAQKSLADLQQPPTPKAETPAKPALESKIAIRDITDAQYKKEWFALDKKLRDIDKRISDAIKKGEDDSVLVDEEASIRAEKDRLERFTNITDEEKAAPTAPAEKAAAAVQKVAEHIQEVASGEKKANPEPALDATTGVRAAKEIKSEYLKRVEAEMDKGIEESESTIRPRGEETPNEWLASSKNGAAYGTIEKAGNKFKVSAQRPGYNLNTATFDTMEDAQWFIKALAASAEGKVTLDIPGDGKNTVWRSGDNMVALWKKVKSLETGDSGTSKIPVSQASRTPTAEKVIKAYGSPEKAYQASVRQAAEMESGEEKTAAEKFSEEIYKSTKAANLEAQGENARATAAERRSSMEEAQAEIDRIMGLKKQNKAHLESVAQLKKEVASAKERMEFFDKQAENYKQQAAKEKAAITPQISESMPLGQKPINEPGDLSTGKLGEVGMGAARVGETRETPTTPTATKNAIVEQERAKRGLPPAIEPARREFGRVWDEAMAKIDQNPAIEDELIAELNSHPRAIKDVENALLLHRQIELQNDYAKQTDELAHAYDDSKEFPNRLDDVAELKARVAGISDRLFELYEVNKRVGTETARGLNSRKMMAYEDYSLAQMELGKRAANGGRPLTEDERAQVLDIHQKILKATKDFQDYIAESEKKISDLEAKKALDEVVKTSSPPVEPHIRVIADKIKANAKIRADAALARLKAKWGTERMFSGPIDPTDLDDLAEYGFNKILEHGITGAEMAAEWAADMATTFGEGIKKYLPQIWKAAQGKLDKAVTQAGATTDQAKAKAKRAVKTLSVEERTEAVKARIGKRMAENKLDSITGSIQQLARLMVEDGVSDRNELIDRIHEFLQQLDPEITRREAMDAISGYGKFKQLTKDQVSVELRDLKGQMQQVAKLEDMQAGEPPKKTGLERRIPSKEESRLIKAVNEAKRKFQIPITDPNTQLKSALDTLKTRMQTRIDELNEKLANQDFSARPAREAIKLDAKGLDLHAKLERAKQAFQHALQLDRLKNRTNLEKAQDTLVKWRRGFLLSSPITLAKLTAAAVARMTITPVEEAAGSVIARAVPALAKRTQREGGLNGRAEAKALAGAFTKGMKDAWDVLRTGQSQLDVLYGQGREGYVGESFILPRSVIDFFGAIHGALKAPVKRAEFERSLEKRFASDIRDGADVTDPLVQTRLAVEAFKDANRSIFLQDNRIVSGYKALLRTWEAKSKQTGRVPVGGKLAATAARAVFPIVKVPVNIVAETMQYALGTVSGSARLGLAFRRGIETLKPDEADLIARELKKGTLGAAVLLTGFFLPQYFGGYYQQGEKRKPGEAKYGSIKIDGWNVPSFLLHNPLLEVAQLGATVRRVADSKLHKRDTGKQGITAGLVAGGLGLAEEVPFVNDTLELTKLMNPSQRAGYAGEMAKSYVVPQLVQFIANQTDKNAKGDTIARKPKTLLQHIETGIPGLRQTVPKKNPFEE